MKPTIKITYLKNGVRHVSTFRGITKAEAVAHVERGPVAVWIEGIERDSNPNPNRKMKSQKTRILSWLKSGRTLTPIQALNKFGCFRLSGRILELRRDGHEIETIPFRKGRIQFAKYRLS